MNSNQSSHEPPPNRSPKGSAQAANSDATHDVRVDTVAGEADSLLAVPAIEFRHVDFSYDDNAVLDDLSFQVAKGEIKIILSGSGEGKSTILKLILGLLKPDAGQIFIDGEEITGRDEGEMQEVRDKIGMVFQEGALFDSLTVYENVAYRLHDRGLPEEAIEEEVRPLLQFVKLDKEMDKLPSDLSGGMRKRVSVARALVGNPRIVLFDEPTVALDPPTSGTICDLIIELRDLESVSSIVVTHEMDVVKYLTSEYVDVAKKGKLRFKEDSETLCLTNTNILMLRNGRKIFGGSGRELVDSQDQYIHEFIRGTEMLPEKEQETG